MAEIEINISRNNQRSVPPAYTITLTIKTGKTARVEYCQPDIQILSAIPGSALLPGSPQGVRK